MSKYVIITDSACDLPEYYRKEHNIEYAKMMINWDDKDGVNHETYASLDWDKISKEEFYGMERDGIRIRTAQVTMQNYLEAFDEPMKNDYDILYIACSGALSSSVRLAEGMVREELEAKYPGRRLVVVDSLRASMAQGLQVVRAVDLQKEGKTIDEVKEILEEERVYYWEVGTPETLTYLKRSGRIKSSSAILGNLFAFKPILVLNEIGENYALEKVRGRKASLTRMAELVEMNALNPENETLYLMEADCSDLDIEFLKKQIESRLKFKNIKVLTLGPIIGASSGPGTIIFYFRGRSYLDFKQEYYK